MVLSRNFTHAGALVALRPGCPRMSPALLRVQAMPESPSLPAPRASRAAFPLRFLLLRPVPSPFAFLRFISPASRFGAALYSRFAPLCFVILRRPQSLRPRTSFPSLSRSFLHAPGRAGRITPLRLRVRRLPAPVFRRLHTPERPKITDVAHFFPLCSRNCIYFSQICFSHPMRTLSTPRQTPPNCTFSPDFLKNTAGISSSFRRRKRVFSPFSFSKQST